MFTARFSELYLNNYSRLLRIARVYIPQQEEAENLVHDVFVSMWEHREEVMNMEHCESYLAVSLKNRCLDYLKHLLHVAEYADHITETSHEELTNKINSLNCYDAATFYDNEIINNAVKKAVEGLPPRCRQVFLLSRHDQLKNAEIAERMGISENTVEAQMTIALRKLRAALSEFLPKSNR